MAKQTNDKPKLELVLEPTNDTANTEQLDKLDDLIKDGVDTPNETDTALSGGKLEWTVVKQFRDIKDFNLIHKVGDVVEHTQEREDNGLIELK